MELTHERGKESVRKTKDEVEEDKVTKPKCKNLTVSQEGRSVSRTINGFQESHLTKQGDLDQGRFSLFLVC